ncbi:MAG: alpha-xylosidase [Ignavibacteriae bacterium]|nr:alpha-xylosidase [Ignavibacteriota bacterium]
MKINNFKKNFIQTIFILIFITNLSNAQISYNSPDQNQSLLNEPIDISGDFRNFSNTYYVADSLSEFDPITGNGKIKYLRHEYVTRFAFNNIMSNLEPVVANEFPSIEYESAPELPFSIEFVSAKTIRIKIISRFQVKPNEESLMLVNGFAPIDKKSWKYNKIAGGHSYKSEFGTIKIFEHPWYIKVFDMNGKLLINTLTKLDDAKTYIPLLPFSFVRRASDYSTSVAAVFSLSPNEGIYGCGESFTEFNKRGQKVVLWTDDANGVQNETMYKPIPFFMSSRGYGIFMHTSSPITCDFGKYYKEATTLMIGDDVADLFIFLGKPKDILNEYTNLTGKPAMPPLWSFGFWMSRITYFSEVDGRTVVNKLRENKIPTDVLHFDTGWFETDWRCDYQFSKSRFKDAKKMILDFKEDGIQTCLWQLPYFVPKNSLFPEIIAKGLFVKDQKGNLPYEDAVLDFSNPETVKWYQEKIGGLLDQGVGVIKVDFGEAAPANGIYHSGKSGFYEHNLYPLRYNKTVAEVTKQKTGETIIWARSTWAGSQRYPLHWGGDAENTNSAMAATLRGGLSLGLSGFSFWSHDIGGFVNKKPEDLYRRWIPFGMLTSHTRSHGNPPTEPWEYGNDFMNAFRNADNMRYKLMPYIYAQAKECTEKGLPMLRALFVEFPDDPGTWLVDDQYLFGSDLLVAPLFENVKSRNVYLPQGNWIDYQTEKVYTSGWYNIEAGEIPIVVLVKDGTIIPHIELVQSTAQMDWSKIELKVFSEKSDNAEGIIYLPNDPSIKKIAAKKVNGKFVLDSDPYIGKVKFEIN